MKINLMYSADIVGKNNIDNIWGGKCFSISVFIQESTYDVAAMVFKIELQL